jgi:hypothetical protein
MDTGSPQQTMGSPVGSPTGAATGQPAAASFTPMGSASLTMSSAPLIDPRTLEKPGKFNGEMEKVQRLELH